MLAYNEKLVGFIFLGNGTKIIYDITIFTKPHYYSIKAKKEISIEKLMDPEKFSYCYGLKFNENTGFDEMIFKAAEFDDDIYCIVELKYATMINKKTGKHEKLSIDNVRKILVDNKQIFND